MKHDAEWFRGKLNERILIGEEDTVIEHPKIQSICGHPRDCVVVRVSPAGFVQLRCAERLAPLYWEHHSVINVLDVL